MAENANTQNLQPPPPDPELRRLDPLVGTWKAKDQTQDSILGPGVPVTNTENSIGWKADTSWSRHMIQHLATTPRRKV